jgi:hypothetical protein
VYIDYNNYSYFGHLCEVPKDVLNNLKDYYDIIEKTDPNLNDAYYKQWYIQTNHTLKKDYDLGYTDWNDLNHLDVTKDFFSSYIDKIYRFRYSWLNKDRDVRYHSNHMLPRIHIPLNDSGSVFVIKDKEGVEYSYNLEYGHAHFINVTLPHRVITTKDVHRKNSFFSFAQFKDKNIESKFLK